jgi:arsenate reductase (glutaredoxin)
LALIRNANIEPEVIEYLVTPPSKNELIQMIADAGLTVREAIRKNVAPYTELGIDQEDWTEDQLLNFMLQYPILINRPFFPFCFHPCPHFFNRIKVRTIRW